MEVGFESSGGRQADRIHVHKPRDVSLFMYSLMLGETPPSSGFGTEA